MTSNARDCLRCGTPMDSWLHFCPARVVVIDPALLRSELQDTHPLDRLTMGDWMNIYGEDQEAAKRDLETRMEEHNAAYLQGPLTYRVELHNLSGLGFQGGVDYWSITVEGGAHADLRSVLEFINSDSHTLVSLNRDDIYLCKLVSLDSEGIKYVWEIKRLLYDSSWIVSEFE